MPALAHFLKIIQEPVLQKIPVSPGRVYDLSGYAGGGGSSPYALFDENAYVDPRYEKPGEGFIPVTNCQPTIHPAIYFQGAKGNRIVVDLKIPYNIREVYYYDRSRTSDSCWLYTGNMKKWKPVAAWSTASQVAGIRMEKNHSRRTIPLCDDPVQQL